MRRATGYALIGFTHEVNRSHSRSSIVRNKIPSCMTILLTVMENHVLRFTGLLGWNIDLLLIPTFMLSREVGL